MSVHKKSADPGVPTQTRISSDLGAVTQNVWVTVAHLYNVEFSGFGLQITVADETVECRVTIDGEVYEITGTALAFAGNKCLSLNYIRGTSGGFTILTGGAGANMDFQYAHMVSQWMRGKDVLIEARKTTAGGASHILAYGMYGQW